MPKQKIELAQLANTVTICRKKIRKMMWKRAKVQETIGGSVVGN